MEWELQSRYAHSQRSDVLRSQDGLPRKGRTLSELQDGNVGDVFLPAPLVQRRYNISDMTLWRWLHSERMSFPRPHRFGRYRYWKLSDLTEWEEKRAH